MVTLTNTSTGKRIKVWPVMSKKMTKVLSRRVWYKPWTWKRKLVDGGLVNAGLVVHFPPKFLKIGDVGYATYEDRP